MRYTVSVRVVRIAISIGMGVGIGHGQTPQPAGMITATASQSSPAAKDGIVNALGACPATGGCTVEIDPAYRGVENLPVPRTDFSQAIDLRNGFDVHLFHNLPVGNRAASHVEEWVDKSTGAGPVRVGGWGGYHTEAVGFYLHDSTPGWTLGTTTAGPGGWSTGKVLQVQGDTFGNGIQQAIGVVMETRGTGDKAGIYVYENCYGGATAGSDEGCEGIIANAGEGSNQYAATLTGPAGVGPGATSIKTSADAGRGRDPMNQGDGRFWVEDAPLASIVVVSARSPYVLDRPTILKLDPKHGLSANLVSTAWGTLNASVQVPQVVPAGGTTSVTFELSMLGGAFTAHPGDTVCFGGNFHEQAAVTAVSGTNGSHITALLRHSHVKGSWVVEGGAACSVIDFDANHTAEPGSGSHIYDFPFDVVGATDATTLLVAQFFHGAAYQGFWFGNVVFGSSPANRSGGTITNQHGLITIPVDDNVMHQHPELANQAVVTISGARTASFNGTCKNLKYLQPGIATCTGNPAHDGDTETGPVQIAVGPTPYGNGTATLHRAAEIVDVRNPALLNTDPEHVVDGTLMLEANHLTNAIGSTGHVPHAFAEAVTGMRILSTIDNPYSGEYSAGGIQVVMQGEGIRGNPGLSINSQAALRAVNFAPRTTYAGNGGTAYPPNFLEMAGPFQNALISTYSPYPSGSAGISYGCPPETPGDCANPNYRYFPNIYRARKGEFRETFTPFTGESLRSAHVEYRTSIFRQSPDGFGFDAPMTANAITATAVATPLYTPASSSSDCPKDSHGNQVAGAIWGDGNYLYECVAPNKIKRTAALSNF